MLPELEIPTPGRRCRSYQSPECIISRHDLSNVDEFALERRGMLPPELEDPHAPTTVPLVSIAANVLELDTISRMLMSLL